MHYAEALRIATASFRGATSWMWWRCNHRRRVGRIDTRGSLAGECQRMFAGVFWDVSLTRSWCMASTFVLLSGAALGGAPGCSARDPEHGLSGLTATTARNATYENDFSDSGHVELQDGRFTEPVAEGSAGWLTVNLEETADGDLDGDGMTDIAAVLVTRPGGSGVFYSVHALLWRPEEAIRAGSVFLGDRIRLQSVRIEGALITLQLLDRRDHESYADEPTVPVIRRFLLRDGGLAELAAP